jgi:molybdenum cofactor cytidylyltransferase
MARSHIAILLLAAGSSSRFGSPKQLLPYKGRALIRHLTEVALESNADQTYVILGSNSERMLSELRLLSLRIVENSAWKEGLASSIRAGVRALPNDVDAAIIMLADQPFVSREILNALIEKHRTSDKPIVASEYAGTVGVPALFARSLFPELLKLRGDRGAKAVIQRHENDVAGIAFPQGEVDIDRQTDTELLG